MLILKEKTNQSLSMDSTDRYSLSINKNFNPANLGYNIDYGLQNKIVKFKLSKSITDTISADFISARVTDRSLSSDGDAQKSDRIQLNYSIQF